MTCLQVLEMRNDSSIAHFQAVIPLAVLSQVHGGLLTGHFGNFKRQKRLVLFAHCMASLEVGTVIIHGTV